jgi:formylglycine-generating enzyme required for sulfatase activity
MVDRRRIGAVLAVILVTVIGAVVLWRYQNQTDQKTETVSPQAPSPLPEPSQAVSGPIHSSPPPAPQPPVAAVPSPPVAPAGLPPVPSQDMPSAESAPQPALPPAPSQDMPSAESAPQPQPDVPPPRPDMEKAPVNIVVQEPDMISLPGGKFMMGSNNESTERPIHAVTVRPFSISKYPVTVRQWKQCVAANVCPDVASNETGPTSDNMPVSNVHWNDAKRFTDWLSDETKKPYRLPSESEWEYAVRGGTQTEFWWGNSFVGNMGYCRECGAPNYDLRRPVSIGSFKPNPFGLYDMTGEVAEWVADCWHRDYEGAPNDGAAWDKGGAYCPEHVLRGASWTNNATYLRSAIRDKYDTDVRYVTHGFRVAR